MKTLFIKYSILFLLIIGISSPSFSQAVDENFVRSQHVKVPVKTKVAITALPEDNSAISIGYSDGLGRNIQLISVGASPGKKDVVQPIVYDVFGRNAKQYLPYTMNVEGQGDFDHSTLINQANFYENTPRIEHTNFPYSEVVYDGSPQNQVLESSAPGESWQIESVNIVKNIVRTNTLLDAVRIWEIIGEECISTETYLIGDLSVNEVIDNNGFKRISYSDKLGRAILVRMEVSIDEYAEMYNVYDDFGNLTFVLPPNAIKQMHETGGYSSASIAEDLIFQYKYNKRGLPIGSKTPGANWNHFIYDKQNRLILSQNGNMATENKWQYFKFDIVGRPIIQGIYTLSDPAEEIIIENALETGVLDVGFQLFEIRASTEHGYTNNAFPNTTIEDQFYYYYDDYDFNGDGTDDYEYITPPLKLTSEEAYGDESGYSKGGLVGVVSVWNQLAERNRGKLTGTKTVILNPDEPEQWLTTVNFYSKYDRMIQIQSDNHLGGQDVFDSYYNFDGLLLKSLQKHEIAGVDPVSIFNRFKYDHAGRLSKVVQQNNSETPVVLNQNNYNELSQLIEKNQHGSIGGDDYLQSIDYSYNIRGFLTHINNLELESDRDAGGLVGGYSEELEAVELDRVTIGVAVEQDRFGNRLANITLVAASKLIYEQQAGGTFREVNDQSSSSKVVQESSQNQNTFLALQSIGTPIIIEFADLAISESHVLDSVLILTEDRVIASLTGLGITDEDAIGTLISLARDHVVRIGGKHYHNDDNNDLFGLEIKYQNPIDNGMSPTALYNGNISQVLWQSATDEVKRSYSYEYDRLNRLIDANYTAYDEVMENWTKNTDRYTVSNIDYDHNGNILGLNRNGFNESEAYSSIDELTYVYDGNRLKAVQDIVETGAFNDFSDGISDLETEYIYDANGNMISDLNKGITIEYNCINLPKTIFFESGKKIDFIYNSNGLKLKTIFQNSDLSTVTRNYIEGFVYNESDLDFFATSEGRVVANGGEFSYEYHHKDHLGNLRLAYSDLNSDGEIDIVTEVLQESHYYPYGMEIKGLGDIQIGPEHQYKFNGKEIYEQFDLNWMDFGLRFYDASTARWSAIDPVIHFQQSPYNAFDGNPIYYVDPDGGDGMPFCIPSTSLCGNSVYDPESLLRYINNTSYARAYYGQDGEVDFMDELGIIWFGMKEELHHGLDVIGMVPVIGEVADYANGVIYSLEGRSGEATLSFAATVPIVGAGATITKWGKYGFTVISDVGDYSVKQVIKYADLDFKSLLTSKEIIYKSFRAGTRDFSRMMKRTTGLSGQAHHIIPLDLIQKNDHIEKLVRNGWDMNQWWNGKMLPFPFHANHPSYTTFVGDKINNYVKKFGEDGLQDYIEKELIPELEGKIDLFLKEYQANPDMGNMNKRFEELLNQ